MKSFTTILSAVLGFTSVVSSVSGAAISDSAPAAPSATGSVTASESATPILPPTTDTGFPTPTGGYVVTGIYTTCLTLTFAAPTPTDPIPIDSTDVTPSATGLPSSILSTLSAPTPSGSVPLSSGDSGATSIPVPDVAVFTTCLAFLPTATATETGTATSFTGSATFISATESASGFPSASASEVIPSAF